MSTPLENCNLLLDYGLRVVQIVVTAGAAFAGATVTHFYTKRRQSRDEETKYRSLALASLVELTIQVDHTVKTLSLLNSAESKFSNFLTRKEKVDALPLLSFLSQASSMNEIKKSLLGFRADSRLYAEMSILEGWTTSIVATVNQQYNSHVLKLAEHLATPSGGKTREYADDAPYFVAYDLKTVRLVSDLETNTQMLQQAMNDYLKRLSDARAWLQTSTKDFAP